MRRLVLAVTVALAVTGFAGTATGGVKRHYSHAYYSAAARCGGQEAVGRNVRQHGSTLSNGRHVSPAKYRDLTAKLDGLCRPEPTPVAAPGVTANSTQGSVASSAPVPSAGGGGGCSGMSAESGSSGYNNTSHPGYIGCYQISEDHYSSNGSCHGLGTDPAGQDQCAAIICHTEGTGAWTNPAGQNPCGRLGG